MITSDKIFTTIHSENLRFPLPKVEYGNCWIAGGAVRDSILNLAPSDIDVFGPDKESLDKFCNANLSDAKKVFDSELLRSFIKGNQKYQVIYRPYTTIENCLDSFDYTICQFGYDGNVVVCNPNALIHLFRKRLVVHKLQPEYVVDSLRRIQKYIRKGYFICDGGIQEIVTAIRASTDEEIMGAFEYYGDKQTPRIITFD